MQGLNTKSYLTRTLLNRIFKKELSTEEIEDMVLSGKLIKRFSYYQPSENLLRDLDLIPDRCYIVNFNKLAKQTQFVLRELEDIFNCSRDTANIIARKYFNKKHNYWYKNEILIDMITEGKEHVSV